MTEKKIREDNRGEGGEDEVGGGGAGGGGEHQPLRGSGEAPRPPS